MKSGRGRKRKHSQTPKVLVAVDPQKPVAPPKPFKLPKPRPIPTGLANPIPSKKQLREEETERYEQETIKEIAEPLLNIPHVKGKQPKNIHNTNHSRCSICTLYYRRSSYISSITSDFCQTCFDNLQIKLFICEDPECWHGHLSHALELPKGKMLRNFINRSRKAKKAAVSNSPSVDENSATAESMMNFE